MPGDMPGMRHEDNINSEDEVLISVAVVRGKMWRPSFPEGSAANRWGGPGNKLHAAFCARLEGLGGRVGLSSGSRCEDAGKCHCNHRPKHEVAGSKPDIFSGKMTDRSALITSK
jgi:hypothetical protein